MGALTLFHNMKISFFAVQDETLLCFGECLEGFRDTKNDEYRMWLDHCFHDFRHYDININNRYKPLSKKNTFLGTKYDDELPQRS